MLKILVKVTEIIGTGFIVPSILKSGYELTRRRREEKVTKGEKFLKIVPDHHVLFPGLISQA